MNRFRVPSRRRAGGIAAAQIVLAGALPAAAAAPPVPALPAPRPTAPAYPAPLIAPSLPRPTLDDGGLPPIPVDDPFNEADLGRTAANLLTPQQIQAMLDNEESVYWEAARREIGSLGYGMRPPVVLRQQDVSSLIFPRASERNKVSKKQVALTFDDGPHTATTRSILEALKRYRVPATFFFVGAMAERHPDLVRAVVRDGHSVGNHTYHHVTLRALSRADVVLEIKACGNVIKAASGITPHLFRPPGGQYSPQIARDAAALGYKTILWTCDPGDYERLPPAIIVRRTLKTVTPGAVVILHSGVPETVQALPAIIASLRAAGYTFVTVDTMLNRTP